jgi:hypothetical protein
MVQFSVQNNQLSKGYDDFNAVDPAAAAAPIGRIVDELFCEDSPQNTTEPDFPLWYPMNGGAPKRGRNEISAHLAGLRAAGVKATLLAVADQGNTSITLDSTSGGDEGPHACADKVEFDESGRIKVFWHCSSATHKDGHAGHPAGHSHP